MTALTISSELLGLTAEADLPSSLQAQLTDVKRLPAGRLSERLTVSAIRPSTVVLERPLTTTMPGLNGNALAFRRPVVTSSPMTGFRTEQQFEGMVVSVDAQQRTFVARLADLTAPAPEEEAEIAFEEISADDHSLIVPGALFMWTIGRMTRRNGQVSRVSEIRFRRFFRLTPEAIAKAEQKATEMWELLNDGDAAQPAGSTLTR